MVLSCCRHSSKEIVVFHIRQFHKPKRGESVSILSQNHLMSVPDDGESEENAEPQTRKARIAAGKGEFSFASRI